MIPIPKAVISWYQVGKGWCLDFYYGHDFVMRSRRHWAAGCMFGFSVATSIFFGDSNTPWIFSYGAILGLIASTAKYASQNSKEIIQYGGPTALTLLAITLLLFHGLTSWIPVFTWLPVFVSTTLLAAVNIAPGVTEMFIAVGEGLFVLRELREPTGTLRNQALDVEQGQGLPPGMVELPPISHRRYRSVNSIWSYIHRLPESRHLEFPEDGTSESIELDNDTQSTSSEIRRIIQPLNHGPGLVPQYIAIANIGPMDEHRIYFPEAPQDNPLEMDLGIEGPSLEILVPA